jgi:hypothetical protein
MNKSNRTFNSLEIGEIRNVQFENSGNKTDKRMVCEVLTGSGVIKRDVPFYGGGVDLESGNPHGIFAPPLEGQMVGILYVDSSHKNPVVAFPIPFNWGQGNNQEKYYNLLDDKEDLMIAHKSGSKMIMRKSGDIEIFPAENKEVKINEPGAGDNAARKGDSTLSNSTIDPVFWAWISAAGGVLAGLGVVAPIPTSLKSNINQGSDKVKIG